MLKIRNIDLRFVGKSDDERAFTIDSISGIIRTKRPLDRESREYYDLVTILLYIHFEVLSCSQSYDR
jgi:hypothetical protein